MSKSSNYIDTSDADLVKQIKSNPTIEIKSILFTRYIEKVFGVCLKYLKHEEDARDAMMSIYELFLKKIETHNVKNVNAWIYVVSKNYCFDLLRKKKRDGEKKDAYLNVQFDQSYHPYSEDHDDLSLNKLEDCIQELNQDQSFVINMFYHQKMSYDEICQKLEISWSKMRSRLQNARRNLKICMEKE